MHKATLLVMLGIAGLACGQCTTTSTFPCVVAKARLVAQKGPIATATIFTPSRDGLFRISPYMTITTSDPTSQSYWYLAMRWTDDAGTQNATLSSAQGNFLGPATFPFVGTFGDFVFEAKRGTPISLSLTPSPVPDNSVYSLYYVVEVLEFTP